MQRPSLGILGVGHLASYTVQGLRRGGDQRSILLSPRGRDMAVKLATRCDCQIAISNQQVIDQSDLVLLAVRPDHLSALLEGLSFRPGQTVISVMAGISLEQLGSYPELSRTTLIRALPSASAEVNAGPVPLYPDHSDVYNLFSALGQVVPLPSEDLFNTSLTHACLHGWSYFLVQGLIDWSKEQGMDETTARQLVAHSIGSAITFAEANPEQSYRTIGEGIASEGTFTRQGIDHIQANAGIQSWIEAMDEVVKQQH